MRIRNLTQEQSQPLTESWHSFYQQQQQEEVVNSSTSSGQPPNNQQQQQQADLNQQQQQQAVSDDPFKDIPMDNLDDATKAALEKARLGYAGLSKAQKEQADKLTRLEQTAARYQSAADKAHALLQKHNLIGDGNGNNNFVKSPEDQQKEQLEQVYLKKGMQPAQAKAYAEIFVEGMNVLKPGILNEVGGVLGPAIGKLNTIAADRYLEHLSNDAQSQMALRIPGVRDSAKSILDTMIQNRQDINETGVKTAIQLALGEALMKSGGDLTNLQQQLKNIPPVNQNNNNNLLATLFGGNLGGTGNFIPNLNNGGRNGNAPVAANDDTARAAAAVAAVMDRETKKGNR